MEKARNCICEMQRTFEQERNDLLQSLIKRQPLPAMSALVLKFRVARDILASMASKIRTHVVLLACKLELEHDLI